jgi:hypothetical protein
MNRKKRDEKRNASFMCDVQTSTRQTKNTTRSATGNVTFCRREDVVEKSQMSWSCRCLYSCYLSPASHFSIITFLITCWFSIRLEQDRIRQECEIGCGGSSDDGDETMRLYRNRDLMHHNHNSSLPWSRYHRQQQHHQEQQQQLPTRTLSAKK